MTGVLSAHNIMYNDAHVWMGEQMDDVTAAVNESTEVQTLGAVYTTREERRPAMPTHCVWT